ncbi:Hippurate hydrolase [Neorhizobium galegae bv. officinalis]|uniref:Hippurate hydrolase n=1 Tax=Neorhizobium galegae bv. officinalis TaxID=323656 RepID=A0A0T7H1L2_NEOGA|nr:M20 aminoacylase family protein [Neorhizobium galegae]CDZ41422.1 Hippurate hydrolase [Neorhizobium galegae bv. officinalis]CDZ53420.1 Hippurate hydrolase [Neorhizobium galegae bv. officinalis]
MTVIPELNAMSEELTSLRRWFHSHPELGFEEFQTADRVAAELGSYGVKVHRGFGRTGVVGTLQGIEGKRSIGLRADMDALPMQELNMFSHRSKHPGKMHACGHDGHMVMLLGAAKYLSQHRDFKGTVVFIFSPAEENGSGAKVMVDDGLFESFPVDAVFGLHNWPGMPTNTFGVRKGAILAGSADFDIRVIGTGAHAAMPHNANDPLLTAAHIVTAVQGIITRNKNPLDPAVLTVAKFHSGEARNVIPDEAEIAGTVRALTDETLDFVASRIQAVAENVAIAHGCKAEFKVKRCPVTINTLDEADFAASVMQEMFGVAAVDDDTEPSMGTEDFSYILRARPGAFSFLGAGDGSHRQSGHGSGPCLLHNTSYDFNDALLPVGATYWVELTRKWLSPLA